MPDFLLDCNHLAGAIRKVSILRDRLQQTRRTGRKLVTCFPMLCELEVGIQQTADPEAYRKRLGYVLKHIRRRPAVQFVWRSVAPTDIEDSFPRSPAWFAPPWRSLPTHYPG